MTTQHKLKLYLDRHRIWRKAIRNNDPFSGANDPEPDMNDYKILDPAARMAARSMVEQESKDE